MPMRAVLLDLRSGSEPASCTSSKPWCRLVISPVKLLDAKDHVA